MDAVAIALAAALSWGVADFVAGLQSRRNGVLTVLVWVQGAGILTVLAAIALTGEPWPDGRTLLLSVAAGIAGLGALGAFYRALAIGTMSIVAPISATGVTLPVVVGLATGDDIAVIVAVGLVVTFAGVVLASREGALEGERARASRSALGLSLLAALGFGTYFVFADAAADGSVLWLLAIGRITVLPFVALFAHLRGATLIPAAPRDRWILLAAGQVDLVATGLYALATTLGALSVVAVLAAMYPVATLLLARLVLKETLTRVQAVGVATALAGVALVSAG